MFKMDVTSPQTQKALSHWDAILWLCHELFVTEKQDKQLCPSQAHKPASQKSHHQTVVRGALIHFSFSFTFNTVLCQNNLWLLCWQEIADWLCGTLSDDSQFCSSGPCPTAKSHSEGSFREWWPKTREDIGAVRILVWDLGVFNLSCSRHNFRGNK